MNSAEMNSTEMMNTIYKLSESKFFWLLGIAYLLSMEGIALYFHYALEYYPCALCVQIRAWIAGTIILATLSAFLRKHFWLRWSGLTLTTLLLGGALYTSWVSWGVEKGTIVSSCTMGAGFPTFMPLDQWIPWLFRADGFCGQSPEMWFGLSMNETLMLTVSPPFIVLLAVWLLHARQAFSGQE